jgi:hypothetical protein
VLGDRLHRVERPTRFEDFRYLGDKRTQTVYDLDADDPELEAKIDELMKSESFAVFGPDSLEEARNRGYHLDRASRPPRSDDD